ncbi:hypothetical protein ABID22_003342, partial [Pontibacter aydingkolensis]
MHVKLLLKPTAKWRMLYVVALLASLSFFGVNAFDTYEPTVVSDKEDYSPGQTAIIEGFGWTQDSLVDIHLVEDPAHEHHHGYHDTKVDSTGYWKIEYPIEDRHLGVTFTVEVVGKQTGKKATTTFTDAGLQNVSVVGSSFCSGQSLNVSFEAVSANLGATGQFPSTADFIAELSNASGSFANPVKIGELLNTAGSGARNITAIIPSSTPSGSGYRIRVRSENPVTNQPDNGLNLTISKTPSAPSASSNSPVTVGGSLNLFASAITGATYSWTGPNGFTSNQQNPSISYVTAAAEGNYSVIAKVGECTSVAATVDVVINTIQPTALEVATATGTYGGTTSFSATLTSGGSPLSDKTISFTLNGSPVGSAITNSNGIATLSNVSIAGINASSTAYAGAVGASFAAESGYAASTGSGNLTVNKASSTIAVTGSNTFTYDGTAQGPATSTITGSTGAVTYTYTGTSNGGVAYAASATKPTLAGSYSVTAMLAADDNYDGKTSAAYSFTIGKAPSVTTVTITGATFTYTGSAITPATVSVTGAGGLDITPDAAYSNNTNAGTATASFSYAETANHLASSDSKTFTIGKAATTTVVTLAEGPFTYTGSAITPATVSVTGAGGLDITPDAAYSN